MVIFPGIQSVDSSENSFLLFFKNSISNFPEGTSGRIPQVASEASPEGTFEGNTVRNPRQITMTVLEEI